MARICARSRRHTAERGLSGGRVGPADGGAILSAPPSWSCVRQSNQRRFVRSCLERRYDRLTVALVRVSELSLHKPLLP